jgi:hypothetical protein
MKVRLVLDMHHPWYQTQLDKARSISAESGHLRGVVCFKTFDEFNDFKEIFEKRRTELPNSNRPRRTDGK